MPFGWFDTEELDEFADSLVAELMARFPPSGVDPSKKKTLDKLRKLFGSTLARTDRFARSHKLNVFRKAHFANRVRWALKEAGYAPEFVETMTRELATHMALESGREKGV
jgi:hypothetical protein